jgi:hypothetical protein
LSPSLREPWGTSSARRCNRSSRPRPSTGEAATSAHMTRRGGVGEGPICSAAAGYVSIGPGTARPDRGLGAMKWRPLQERELGGRYEARPRRYRRLGQERWWLRVASSDGRRTVGGRRSPRGAVEIT